MRVRSGSDDGFTLVELMAALTVLAIGIVGTIGVMNSAIGVAGTTGARSKGVAVASKHIETLRAVPYDQLWTTAVAPNADLPSPIEDRVGNRPYYVIRVVTKVTEATAPQPNTAGTPRPNAYLKGFVSVTWTDGSGAHEVHQTTLIYPGGKGLYDVSGTVAPTGSGGTPDPPLSLVGTPVATATAVDLVWVPPAPTVSKPAVASYVVQYSPDPAFPSANVQEVAATIPAAVTVFRVTDLAAGTGYYFRISSKAANGSLSTTAAQSAQVITAGSAAVTCAVGTASVTPSAVNKKNASDGGGLETSPQVVVNTFGVCTGTTFRMEYSPSAGINKDIELTAGASGTFSGTIPGLNNWDVGDHDVKIFSYAASVKTSRATLRLTVCAHNKRTCP